MKHFRKAVPIRYRLTPLVLWLIIGSATLSLWEFLVLGGCYLLVFNYTYTRLFKHAFYLTPYYTQHITKLYPEFKKLITWKPILIRCRQIELLSFFLIEALLFLPLVMAFKFNVFIGSILPFILVGQWQSLCFFSGFRYQQRKFSQVLADVVKRMELGQENNLTV